MDEKIHILIAELSCWLNEEEDRTREHEIYFAGVIDILQQYNHVKTVENFFKGFVHDRDQISAVPAQQYADRFIEFLDSNII